MEFCNREIFSSKYSIHKIVVVKISCRQDSALRCNHCFKTRLDYTGSWVNKSSESDQVWPELYLTWSSVESKFQVLKQWKQSQIAVYDACILQNRQRIVLDHIWYFTVPPTSMACPSYIHVVSRHHRLQLIWIFCQNRCGFVLNNGNHFTWNNIFPKFSHLNKCCQSMLIII